MRNKLSLMTVFAAATMASSLSFGQVKIGSNPTVISPNTNLEVQATNGHRTVVKQDNGFVGIGTITPNTHLNVDAGNMSVSYGANNNFAAGVLGSASVGRGNGHSGNWSMTIGQENAVSGIRSLAVGFSNGIFAAADHSLALGQNCTVNAANSFAGGNSSVTSGLGSLAFGNTSRASGEYSVALGNQSRAVGDGSTALGHLAVANGGQSFAAGNSSVAHGAGSVAMGVSSIASGLGSVAIGRNVQAIGNGGVSLGWLTRGDGPASVALGYDSWATQNTAVAIGAFARAVHDNAFVFTDNSAGGTALGSFGINTMTMRFQGGYRFYTNGAHTAGVQLTTGDVTWGAISDIRSKEDISDIQSGLATVMQLRPKKYHYKKTDKKHFSLGFIAQEMVKVLPDIVNVPEDKEDLLSIRYTELVPVLTKAIQEQQAEIETLKAANAKLAGTAAQVASLADQIKELKQMMGTGKDTEKTVSAK